VDTVVSGSGGLDYGDPDLYTSADRFPRWRALAVEDRIEWSAPGSSPTGFWSVFSHRPCSRRPRRSPPSTG
jgi:hydroxylation protein CepL